MQHFKKHAMTAFLRAHQNNGTVEYDATQLLEASEKLSCISTLARVPKAKNVFHLTEAEISPRAPEGRGPGRARCSRPIRGEVVEKNNNGFSPGGGY